MRAVYYEQFRGPISIREVQDPVPGEQSVVIQVEASGLCLSDWHGWMGHDPDILLPHVPGHELAGTVVEAGKGVRKWKTGDRVTVPFVGGCGKCKYCTEGNPQVCDHQFQPGFTAWGSFAEYVAIDYADQNLALLPEDMPFEEAASLGCRFITAFRGVVLQGRVEAGQSIAVFGCGGVGLSAIQIAGAMGAKVFAVDITDDKCNLAKNLGADFTINASREDPVAAIREYSKGGVHISVDALGHVDTCLQAIHSLRKRGRHVQLGLMTGKNANTAIPMDKVIAHELEILGSHGMQAAKYTELFRFIEEREIDLNKMIGRRISLSQVPDLLPRLNNTAQAGITIIDNFKQ
ncbi:zinc-dependent alcohol dehydrogenase family protein [Lentiprolixibacter aurantiacus]|uniref:Zinc-dependent alcohol dehydrogenase family protein n=1 Tax=Lentiprolixibacter aurantiacus TaxID=2993939 RepID=A0AAE3MLI7_9FLAO|nr:zinc-dependent alcohol dehydrogenase family protein [Lentiprolixibacter aurantiacus]MCX2719623.1 zinc-dependent alcohol dehydrogenase family protein [Lentiprolixibacter aurantiacus]